MMYDPPKNDGFILAESDLAYERHRAHSPQEGVLYQEKKLGSFLFCALSVTSEKASGLGKKEGRYLTLHFPPPFFLSDTERESLANALCTALRFFLDPTRLLVAALGNRRLTADAFGPLTAERVTASASFPAEWSRMLGGTRRTRVAVCVPDVFAQTGIESVRSVEAAASIADADAVLALDALAARDRQRLLTAIELSDTGTVPGGGVKNDRLTLDSVSLGMPVVSLGIPTVVRADSTHFLVPQRLEEGVAVLAELTAHSINLAFGPSPPAPALNIGELFSEKKG